MPNDILTSIHGNRIGLDVNNDLIVGGVQISDVTAPAGAKNGITITAVELSGSTRKIKLTCTATPLVLTDDPGTVVYGGVKVYDFPEGMLCFMGGVIDGSITGVDVSATFEGEVSLATNVAGGDAALLGNEADLVQATDLTTAVAKVANCDAVSIATALTESGARWHDGTTTPVDMYLNFVIDEDAANATSTGSFTGTIEFAYLMLGDN